jgi:hypothetical protein
LVYSSRTVRVFLSFPKGMRGAPQAISRLDEHFTCTPVSARPAEALRVNTPAVDDEFGCCLDVRYTSHVREQPADVAQFHLWHQSSLFLYIASRKGPRCLYIYV